MRRIRKLFILFFVTLILSGCSVEYNLTLNEDGSINEKVVATEMTNRMQSNTGLKGEQAVNYLYNMFKRNDANIRMTHKSSGEDTIATVTNSLKSLDEYKNNFKSDVFSNVIVEKNNDIVTLTFNQIKMLSSNFSRSLIYDDITVNITLPFKVVDNNADVVNGNTYTWKIKKDEELKTIKISYNEEDKIDSLNIKINNKTYSIHYGIIAVSVIILILLITFIVVFIKNKKNNAL